MKETASTTPAPALLRPLRRSLLEWYRQHHRRLPWRAAPGGPAEPYHVLVSEAMLQQTQVATVVPYFERFIAAFPTVADLAAADEQDVLRLWQGLGYYRRARHLHAAAKAIVERFGGEVPGTMGELLSLPGVGQYTAGAIASIAHGVAAPILDGNVARVLARWFTIEAGIDQPATRKRLWELAAAVVPEEHPGDFNQAMMELGATVCVPRGPRCMWCPVAEHCAARQAGREEELPVVSPRRAPRAVTHHVAAIERGGRYLFEQRPSTGLWSNMWQLPTAEALDGEPIAAWVKERFGLSVEPVARHEAFTHQTTHRTIRFEVHGLRVTGGRLRAGAGVWRRLGGVSDLPLSNPQRRIVAALGDAPRGRGG